MSIVRKRLSPEESRSAALEAARRILLTRGPQAVTLKAVAAEFGKEGAGALAAWMILSGDREALNPILESIRGLVGQLTVGHEDHHVGDTTLWLVLLAMGDSLLGPAIAESLNLDRNTAREIAAKRLRKQIEEMHPRG